MHKAHLLRCPGRKLFLCHVNFPMLINSVNLLFRQTSVRVGTIESEAAPSVPDNDGPFGMSWHDARLYFCSTSAICCVLTWSFPPCSCLPLGLAAWYAEKHQHPSCHVWYKLYFFNSCWDSDFCRGTELPAGISPVCIYWLIHVHHTLSLLSPAQNSSVTPFLWVDSCLLCLTAAFAG